MKMYKVIFLFLGLLITSVTKAQVLDPVKWEVTIAPIPSDVISQENNKVQDLQKTFLLRLTATIEKNWHLYSQHIDGNTGPIPTEFSFENKGVEIIGTTTEPKGIQTYDPTFDMSIKYFEKQAIFEQKVAVDTSFKDPFVTRVTYMVCDDKRCLPPEEKELSVFLNKETSNKSNSDAVKLSDKDLKLAQKLDLQLKQNDNFHLKEIQQTQNSSWKIFLLGCFGGFLALLTPCVFPMIPLTVSFFSHQSKKQGEGITKAFLYGVFIILAYVLVSVPFHILDSANPNMLNTLSTNVWLNVCFFLAFVFFAFSFFGYYEITLPARWTNALDDKANRLGGILGVFFMALTLVIVSFSCTGPILGSLLGSTLTQSGAASQLTYGLTGFGLALALPFGFFASFPGMLKKLPKSGNWMVSVKVVLGFIELAFAFKFLSNADLVAHWGILKREVFIGIWIVIFTALFLYLVGWLSFKNSYSTQKPKVSNFKKGISIIVLSFVAYLSTGLLLPKHNKLQYLSGFLPPIFYTLNTDLNHESDFSSTHLQDFYEAKKLAKLNQKPMLIDFTGWACVNCRKMEEQVWTHPKVKTELENYIIVSLYVDDRSLLPEDQKFTFKYPNSNKYKKVSTIGDQWSVFQTLNFQNNSQPYYVLLDTDGKLIEKPLGYTTDTDLYVAWLQSGQKHFNKSKVTGTVNK